MVDISGIWSGTIEGTNNGSVFAKFLAVQGSVTGVVQIVDPIIGVGLYDAIGERSRNEGMRLVLTPDEQSSLSGHGIVTVLAQSTGHRTFVGEWRSSIGTAGMLYVAKLEDRPLSSERFAQNQEESIAPAGSSAQSVGSPPAREKIFISYSHHDTEWLERLRVHLKPLERDYALDVWDDTNVQTGSIWFEEIEEAIQSARVALLVVSADFLASDFITNNELPPLLDAAKNEGTVVMPIIVSPSRFSSTVELSQFQAVNDPSEPLINMPKGQQEVTLVKLTEDIEAVLRRLSK